jgi:hypothetical protein
MSVSRISRIEQAKRAAVLARSRFDTTLAAVQTRLRPGNLAEEAWDGVKEKGADLADGALQTVKQRPGATSLALGAFALFLARGPVFRAVGRLIAGDGDEEGNQDEDAALRVEEGVS